MAEARLKGKLTMDDSQFQAVLRRSAANAVKFSSGVGKSIATAGVVGFSAMGAAALGASAALAVATKRALDLGGTFSDLRSRTGASVKSLVLLDKAFTDAGIGGEKVGDVVNRLQKAIEGGNPALEEMGLNLDALKKLSPDQQLATVGRAIMRLKSPSEQTAAAMEIFGKSGGQLLTLFSDTSALKNAAAFLGSMPDILEKNADRFDAMSDKLNSIPDKLPQFGAGLADAIPPEFDAALDRIVNLDTAKIGQSLGRDISNKLKDKSIYDAVGDIGAGFITVMSAAALSIGKILGAQVLQALNGPAMRFQARIEHAASTMLRMLNIDKSVDIPDLDRTIQIKTEMRDDIGRIGGGKDGLNFIGKGLQKQIDDLNKKRADAIASGNSAESLEDIYARLEQSGGAKAGFGQGASSAEIIEAEIEKLRAMLAKLIPSTVNAATDELNKPEQYGPPIPPGFFGGAPGPSTATAPAPLPSVPAPSQSNAMPAAPTEPQGRQRATKITGAKYKDRGSIFDPNSERALAIQPLIGPKYQSPSAHAKLQSMDTSWALLQRKEGPPSVMSEPSVRVPGQPRTTVESQARATKILGAAATAKKKAEKAAEKEKDEKGGPLEQIAAILESWNSKD